MNSRENMIAAIHGREHEWIPDAMLEMAVAGSASETFENGPAGGGRDGFGVLWKPSDSAGGQGCPITAAPVLEDITKWRDVVKFPNLEEFDWEALAAKQLGRVNRAERAIEYQSWNAQFLRLTHLMGFENALCAMYEEPEECYALMEAITDYKIEIVKKAAQYFKPDFFTSFDDVATERGLFMSPEVYRKLIKPHHKRLNDAVKEYGMEPIMHTCGKCEDIIEDFIEEGAVAWSSAQPVNDIKAIQKKYGSRIAVIGGYDSNGRPGQSDAASDEVEAEVKRCVDEYGSSTNYIMMGFRLAEIGSDKTFLDGLLEINSALKKYGRLR